MGQNLILLDSAAAPGSLATTTASARDYIRQAKAENTIRAYGADWTDFNSWCAAHRLEPLPATPATVALYIAALADQGRRVSTIQRRLAAISKAHQWAGHESPTSMKNAAVSETWKGIRRAKGTAQAAKATVLTKTLRVMVGAIPDGILGLRDRALLLVGFAGALRRSELVGLGVNDVCFTDDGLVVAIRRSKTDQEVQGRKIGIPGSTPATCPVRGLKAWIAVSAITAGPLFRSVDRHGKIGTDALSAQSAAFVVKRRATAAGLDTSKLSGHSFRAGLATSAAMNGASERAIMNQTGHRSTTMVHRYIRDGSLFRENAAAAAGL